MNKQSFQIAYGVGLERSDWRRAFAVAMLVVSVLAGQFTLSRIVPILPSDLTQVRLLTLAVAIVAFWPDLRSGWPPLISPPLIALAALCGYLIIRGLFGHGPDATAKALDICCLLTQAVLAAVGARNAGSRAMIAAAVVVCAFVLFCAQLGGQFSYTTSENAPVGFGWQGETGSITFNRVSFLAFCVLLSVYMPFRSAPRVFYEVSLLLATLFLFGTLGSIQKAALIGTALGILGILGGLVVHREWERAATLVVMTVAALVLAIAFFGTSLMVRLNSSLQISESHNSRGLVKIAALNDSLMLVQNDAAAALDPPPVSNLSSQAIIKLRYCYFKSATNPKWQPGTPPQCYERSFSDGTGRLPLWFEALRGMKASPIFGNGLNTYRVVFIDNDTLMPTEYRYSHNLFMEIGFEGGLVGLTILIVALVVFVRAAFRSAAPALVWIPILGFAGFMFVSVLFAGDIYDSRLLWLTFVLLAYWGVNEGPTLRKDQLLSSGIDRRGAAR